MVIVGGGQGGIALGARLRQLGVPAIIIEKNERPGDSWRKRYKSLCLHDPVWYADFTFAVYPVPGELASVCPEGQNRRLARDVHKSHGAELLEFNDMQIRQYDEKTQEWTVTVERDGKEIVLKPETACAGDGDVGQRRTFRSSRDRIFSRVNSSIPRNIRDLDAYKGKKVVVVGSN